MALLTDRPAFVARPAGVVRVTGPDRLEYLHTLLTQHLSAAVAGTVADFLYLDAKGNPLACGRAVVRDADVLLVTPPDVAGGLTVALQRYRFLLQVEATDDSGRWALASLRAPGVMDVPGAPHQPMTAAASGEGLLVRDRSGGVDLLGPPAWVTGLLAELGLPAATEADWQAWRIAAGEPAWASEIASGRRTQELGLLPTHVHLRKGCYPGQESIAKIHNLGRPRRALAVVTFDGPVRAGDVVEADGKRGEVTSAASLGTGWVALVFVPLGPDGTVRGDGTVAAGDVAGTVRCLVGAGRAIPGAAATR